MARLKNTWCAFGVVALLGCGVQTQPESSTTPASSVGAPSSAASPIAEPGRAGPSSNPPPAATPPAPANLTLNVLFVHGVQNCSGSKGDAQRSLSGLESALVSAFPAQAAAYEAAHPNTTLSLKTGRANLYTATPSGIHPSNSTDPINMDDWKVGDPGCSAKRQGDPCTAAFEWRYRLVQEIDRLFGKDAKNIVIVGHSTGARAAFEVASNTGPDGVNTYDWGVQDRIAGVVTLHGMIDALNSSRYNVQGPFSFDDTCKYSDWILDAADQCSFGNGFCEYAGDVSGNPSADWVAENKRALMLTSAGSCSPSLFDYDTDGTLPVDAQASPEATGLTMTPVGGKTYRAAHGVRYGAFCHSDVTDGNSSRHAAAVSSALSHILGFLFTSAPRVAAEGTFSSPSEGYGQSTPTYTLGSTCPAGEVDSAVQVAGVCHHPGFFDGDDHPVAATEISVTDGPTCNGAFSWKQEHDKNNKHSATFTWKTLTDVPGGLLSTLTP